MASKRKVEELERRGIITITPEKTIVVPGEEITGILKYIQVDSIHNDIIFIITDSPDYSSCASN